MDLNADGFTDILSGSYSRMTQDMAGTFQVLYGAKDGFEPAEELMGTDGEPLIIPADDMTDKICTRPTAVDLDDDGVLDIVTGNFTGTFYLFKGEGKGRFNPKGSYLAASEGDLRTGSPHSDPFFVDWDGDGDFDMLSGSAGGGVYLATNTGTRKAPAFGGFKTIVEPVEVSYQPEKFGDDHLNGPQGSTRVWAADVNGDGKLDLLVGDSVYLMHLADGVDEATAKAKDEKWQEDFQMLLKGQPKDGNANALQAWSTEYQRLNKERLEFVKPDRTGFVWVYIRK